MRGLCNVNVLVALAHARHTHHLTAVRWMATVAAGEAGVCRFTELALLRLLTNRAVMAQAVQTNTDVAYGEDSAQRSPICMALGTAWPGGSLRAVRPLALLLAELLARCIPRCFCRRRRAGDDHLRPRFQQL